MGAVEEIPISTLSDARDVVELGLVAADAITEASMGFLGGAAEQVAEATASCRAQCLSLLRHQAGGLGATHILGASITITVTFYAATKFVIGAHGTGTAVKGTEG